MVISNFKAYFLVLRAIPNIICIGVTFENCAVVVWVQADSIYGITMCECLALYSLTLKLKLVYAA